MAEMQQMQQSHGEAILQFQEDYAKDMAELRDHVARKVRESEGAQRDAEAALERHTSCLALRQVACTLSRALATRLGIPASGISGWGQLCDALYQTEYRDGDDGGATQERADKRLDEAMGQLGLAAKHKVMAGQLQKCGNGVAHPNLTQRYTASTLEAFARRELFLNDSGVVVFHSILTAVGIA